MINISESIEDTIEFGYKLGLKLKAGDIVALIGELGSGKTVFTKGIAKGLGVENIFYVNSPTFVIIREHDGKRLPLYHFDIYRLNRSSLLDIENYEEYFYGKGVTVVEWADKIKDILPKKYIEVRFSVVSGTKRKIEISHL